MFNRTPSEFNCFFRFFGSRRFEDPVYSAGKITTNSECRIVLSSLVDCYPVFFTVRTMTSIHLLPVPIDIIELNSSVTLFTVRFPTVSSRYHRSKLRDGFLSFTAGTHLRTLLNRLHLTGPMSRLYTFSAMGNVRIFTVISFIKFSQVLGHVTLGTLL